MFYVRLKSHSSQHCSCWWLGAYLGICNHHDDGHHPGFPSVFWHNMYYGYWYDTSVKPVLHIDVFCLKTVVAPPTWEPHKNAIKFGVSNFTFVAPRLPYAKARSVALTCDSSAIKTDQVAVQWRHWYGSHTLCHGCTTLNYTFRRPLALIHDVCAFTGARRRFATITHGHWWKPVISRRSKHDIKHIKRKGRVNSANLISLKYCFRERNILLFHHRFHVPVSP